jgi:hypothetical protein
MKTSISDDLTLLNEQLLTVAEAFADDASALSELLTQFVRDVERAVREPLDIFYRHRLQR